MMILVKTKSCRRHCPFTSWQHVVGSNMLKATSPTYNKTNGTVSVFWQQVGEQVVFVLSTTLSFRRQIKMIVECYKSNTKDDNKKDNKLSVAFTCCWCVRCFILQTANDATYSKFTPLDTTRLDHRHESCRAV